MTDLRETYRGLSANTQGALWMLASALFFTVATTLVKFLGESYGAALQAFYRQFGALLLVLPLIARDPVAAFRTTRPGILFFRSAAGTVAMILAFYSIQKMPLAEANALSFTRTLWIVPMAALLLREVVGPYRIGATLVGFAGVLLMLQPGAGTSFGLPALAALGSAFLFAATILGMKVMTRDHSTTVLIAWAATLGVVLAIPGALLEWRWPTWPDFLMLTAMGGLSLMAQTCYIRGMALGDAAAMAPIDYTRLVFALIVGLLLFQEIPNAVTMLGALVVIASTLFITIREARLKKPPPPVNE